MGLGAYLRLARAGYVLAREGALAIVDGPALPPVARAAVRLGRMLERGDVRRTGRVERLTRALNRLGPPYVKLGQTLATRPDIVGAEAAADLSVLQDQMDPFDAALVPRLLSDALGPRAADLVDLSPPVAAASIAQVHRATLLDASGRRTVAVKILRPGIAARFRKDIESFYAGARFAERFARPLRRLRPVEIVRILDRSARTELDLRLEAAAISELRQNLAADTGFTVPEVHWDHSAETVLTTSWVEGVPLRDFAALEAAGLSRSALAAGLLQSFLRQAVRDGFFHADLHPGNLFADPRTGSIVAVDFGIMGRLSPRERRFLAEILYGFISRDYRMIAERHFDIGYVPRHQSVDEFTLALRAIGEPLHGRRAADISMARVLGQLFQTTERFDMQARPELILLQKSMVIVEGVARALDPELDIWTVSEPVVGDFVRRSVGPLGRLDELRASLALAADTVARLPGFLDRADAALAEQRLENERRRRRSGWFLAIAFIALLVIVVSAL
jgi:ubiquinone biosynthesis protein